MSLFTFTDLTISSVPCTAITFFILLFNLKLHNPRTPVIAGLKAVDWLGSLTVVGGTVMFLLGLEFGGVSFPWSSPKVVCLIIFGLVLASLFIINEWKFAKYPVMPMRLFDRLSHVASLLVCSSRGMILIASAFYLA